MNKVELLSPAGDFECLKAAINNGANAVYIGGTNYSARNFAKNFTIEEIEESVKYAHLRNVKIYLAINTLLTDNELNKVIELIKMYYKMNVDALIIQDLGLFYRIKNEFPDFEIHASTQMHIHNLEGVKNAQKLGFSRVVIARESSLENIKRFCKENIEIECFVHGAICVSYSGQCLMSSFIKGRSANRGECAQLCRMKYYEGKNRNQTINNNEYLLSPKDMMLIKDIPKLIESGVSSFKIEGRLKSPSYVGYVTRLYRKAIDSYYNNDSFSLSNTEMDNLKILFNRGFSNSYLYSNNKDLFNNIRPNNIGIEIGTVISSLNGYTSIKLKKELKLNDGIRILNSKEDYGTEIFELYKDKRRITVANKGDIVSIKTSRIFNKNDLVIKTSDQKLNENILSYTDKLNNISLKIKCKTNKNFLIECNINDDIFYYDSKFIPEKALNYPIDKELLIKQFNKVDNHPYKVINYEFEFEECFINIKTINKIRRDFYDNLDNYILNKFKRSKSFIQAFKYNNKYQIENDSSNINIINNKYDQYVLNPTVNLNSIYNKDYNIVSEFGCLLLKGNKIAFYTLNVYNSYAYELLLKLGFNKIILSIELNDELIKQIILNFKNRNNLDIHPYVIKNGHINLMNIYKNPFNKDVSYINDSINTFKIDRFNEYTTLSIPIESFIKHDNISLYNIVNIE